VITIVKAVQTSMACPSQWDAWDEEGRYYYLRYRHGCGSVERAASQEEWRKNCVLLEPTEEHPYGLYTWPGTEFLHEHDFEEGNELDGSISLERFCELAKITLAPGASRTAFWRHVSNELTKEFKDDPAALAQADQLLAGVDLDQEQ
jgi:hypothetical protein